MPPSTRLTKTSHPLLKASAPGGASRRQEHNERGASRRPPCRGERAMSGVRVLEIYGDGEAAPPATRRSASRSIWGGRLRDGSRAAGLVEQSCRKPGRRGAPARATQSGGCARGARGPRTKALGRVRLAVRAAVPRLHDCPAFCLSEGRGRGRGRCGQKMLSAENCNRFPSSSCPFPLPPSLAVL